MDLPDPASRALSSSPLLRPLPRSSSALDDHDRDADPLGLHFSPLTASSLASPFHSDSCSTPRNCDPPRSPLKLFDSVLPMSSLPAFDFTSAGAYTSAYSTIHMNAGTDGALALPPSFSATRHSEGPGLTSPSPAQSYSSQDTFASPFSAASPYTAGPTAHHDYRNRRSSAHSSGAYPPSSPTESSHSHASLVAEREMEALYSWARPMPTDQRALPLRSHEDPSVQFADQLSLKGAFMQSFQPVNRSLTVTVSSTATSMERPSSFGRTPSTSSAHSVDSALEPHDTPAHASVPVFVNRSMPTFPMPMPVTVASALQLPYSAPRQADVAYSSHMQWILPTPQLPRAHSDPIAYQPSPSLTSSVPSALPSFLSSAPHAPMPSVSSASLRGPVARSPFYDRLPIDLLAAPSRSSSKRASPALDPEPVLSSAPQSPAQSPTAFDDPDDLSPVKRARTRPTASAPPTPSDLRVFVKAEPLDPSPSPSARAPASAGRVPPPRVSPPSAKLPRSRSTTVGLSTGLSTPRPGPSPPAKDHVRHQGVEKQRRDRTRQLFDALQDFTAARVMGPDDLRAPADMADPFVTAPTDQPRFAKVQRKGIKLPKEHTLTDALNVLQRQEHELAHYRVLTAALTGPDPALSQRARALLAAPADQAALCSGCGGSLEQCRLDQALREASSPSSSSSSAAEGRKGPRPARSRGPLPQ